VFLMRVRMAKGATVLGRVASALGEAGVDINRLQTRRKDERHVVLDLLLDLPPELALDVLLDRCQTLEGVAVEQLMSYPAGADLHQDLELVQRLARCDATEAPQVLATAAPLLCGGTWAAVVDPADRVLHFKTPRTPLRQPSDLEALGPLQVAAALELPRGLPAGGPATQLAVVPLSDRATLLVGRTGRSPFTAAELARLEHLAEVAAAALSTPGVPGLDLVDES
jgi:hypothetical protein